MGIPVQLNGKLDMKVKKRFMTQEIESESLQLIKILNLFESDLNAFIPYSLRHQIYGTATLLI